ncbi:MAG: Gfo/Idh/MocA family oxidoreductase [Ruminococcaceae bacterium]|nr:Gfo/Idh/MocA family oxidoreductase [Oscillospiraceae bacterium]
MKKYGIMVIGCGHIGCQHLKNIYYRDNIQIVATIDTNEENAKLAARKYGSLEYGTDYKKYLTDDRIDIVIIATYTSTHLEILKECAKNGKHVLCEKPIATNLADGEEFVRIVKESNVKVLVAHILRHNKSYIKIRDLIRSGAIGELKTVRMVQNHHVLNNERFSNLLSDCSPVLDCGVHYVDVMQWFTDSKVCEVSGVGTKIDPTAPNNDYTIMTFRMENGCVGYYEAGWNRNIESQNMKEFIGTKGRISLVLKEMRANDREEGDLITLYNGESGEYRIINNDSQYKDMYGQVCTLIDMIENNTEGNPTIESVFSAFKTACLAQEAIENNTIIRL